MNKYAEGMNEIKASSELKDSLIQQGVQEREKLRRRGAIRRKRIKFTMVAACSFVLVSLISIFLMNPPAAERPQPWTNIFSVTVYAADGQPQQVKADVEFPIGDYRLTNSRAPGFPIIVNVDGADEIKMKATGGSFIRWSAPDYYVNDMGAELTIEPGSMFYWSPPAGASSLDAENITITLTAYHKGTELGSAQINILQDETGKFSGRLAVAE